MNASYKIVLLGAFVVFAAVVGYVIFSGNDEAGNNLLDDDYAQQDPTLQPADSADVPLRSGLEDLSASIDPAVEQETIGKTTNQLPQAPVIATLPPQEEPLVREQLPSDPIESDAANVNPTTEETAETDELIRPGSGIATDELTTGPADTEPQGEPIAKTPTAIPRTYTVKEGDLLSTIAVEFYGQERAWYDIAKANPTVDPKRLQIGQVLVLPDLNQDVRKPEEALPPAPSADQNYTVRPGDNLSKIAKRFYGNSEKWDLIYARNRNIIGPRPNDLKVGMELVIPQAYEDGE